MECSIRPRKVQLSILNNSDGSAAFSQGYTCVWSSVMGPGDLRLSKQIYDSAKLDVLVKQKNANPHVVSKVVAVESMLRDVCKSCILTNLMPRTVIQVTCQELHDDGSLDATVINSACMALLDSGIAMKCPFTSVNAAVGYKTDPSNSDITLDPDGKRETESRANLLLVFRESGSPDLIASNSNGIINLNELHNVVDIASRAAVKNFELYRTVIKSKFEKDAKFGVFMDEN